MATKALLVNLHASHGASDDVERLLVSALADVRAERRTSAWFAVRFGRAHYGVFAAFPDEDARDAHVEGAVVTALLDAADELLDEPVLMQPLDVLAAKLPAPPAQGELAKAVLVRFDAKRGHADAVEAFLRDGRRIVDDEAGTVAWFALHREDGEYGIFDVFPDNHARFEHLTGHLPRELAKHALELLGSFPDMEMLDVVAHHVGGADVAAQPGPTAMSSESP